ncbi:hypothetical protein [Streptomyces orinoci]|uniref:Proteinase inhibitor I42 chagasin domain-containing protein n=1 Tax=Streptomyces orinoci TaxID=67339 RepID=A0ABV3K1W7_STRON|nr:hypothetical protein [Streptomyces orinoci]
MNATKSLALPFAAGLAMVAVALAAPASAAPDDGHPVTAVRDVRLTNADNGRTVEVRPGDTVRVSLTGSRTAGATWAWSIPVSESPQVLTRTIGENTASGDAMGYFRVNTAGSARIQSVKKCVADPGHLCPHLAVLWRVTVVVR